MRRLAVGTAAIGLWACGGDGAVAPLPSGHVPAGWSPGVAVRGERAPTARGFLDRRGLIHAHSVYSHDACDGEPRDEETDAINEPCFDDFRRDVCTSLHDFVMLSDHRDSFTRTLYPDTLLFRDERGDVLVDRDGPVANWAACEGGEPVLIMAGTEAGTMPVGLEGHVSEDKDERSDIYGRDDAEAVDLLKAAGAVALVPHTEMWTVEQLQQLPLDGFEMYNLHINLQRNFGPALGLLTKLESPEELPHPDLILLPILQEEPDYLETWARVLASGARRVTTMGTDCHRNTFKQQLPDGERVDSYRRMMMWFSNHLLIEADADGDYDDVALKEALRARRLYGAFEMFGYPVGFDFHAESTGATVEMGGDAALADGVELVVRLPEVFDLDPTVDAPIVELRLLDTLASRVTSARSE